MTAAGPARARSLRGLGALVAALAHGRRRQVATLVVLLLLVAVTEGVGLLLLVPLLDLVGVGAGGTPSGLPAQVLDAIERTGVAPVLGTVLAVYVGLVAARAGLQWWAETLSTRLRLETVDGLRLGAFRALARAAWPHVLGQRRADLVGVLLTDAVRTNVAIDQLLAGTVGVVLMLAYLAAAVVISPLVTLATVVTVGLVGVALWPQLRVARLLGERLAAANGELTGALTDGLEALKLARAHGAEATLEGRLEVATGRARHASLSFVRTSVGTRLGLEVFAAALLAVVVWFSVEVLEVAASSLVVLAFIVARLVSRFMAVARNLQQLANALPSFLALRDVTASADAAAERGRDVPPGAAGAAGAAGVAGDRAPLELRRAIVFDRVVVTYPGRREPALREVSAQVPAARTTALVGPSGAGKSTLADVLLGLLGAQTGRVTVDGVALTADRLPVWRSEVAYVPQEVVLLPGTLRENLTWLGGPADEAACWVALDQVGAAFARGLPDGLDTELGDRGLRLSGGERQRVALARALLRRPRLLVLDEATSALDVDSERAVHELLVSLHGQLTVLVIAHRLATVRSADHVVVIDGGRVVEEGTYGDLVGRPDGRFAALVAASSL